MTVETLPKKQTFSRHLAAYGAVGALLVSLPELIQGNDFGAFIEGVLALAVVSLALVIVALANARRKAPSALAMLAIYCSLLWLLHSISWDVRTRVRWFLEARDYKREIFKLSQPPPGELKHVEWDGWGFAGAGDTTVYLIFDPSDALSPAAKSRSPGKFPGLPCEVVRVRRLERYWYTALFYTDTDWSHCA